jgi:hypothetical protein
VINAAIVIVVITFIVLVSAAWIEFAGDIRRGLWRLVDGGKESAMGKYNDNPVIYPFRITTVRGRFVARFPAECEPHSLRCEKCWEIWAITRDQRQCRGCGLWVIWEPRAITAGSHGHAGAS